MANEGVEREFRRAVDEIKAAGVAGRVVVSDAHKLELYGLFKQSTDGDCRKAQPSAFQPVERAKWNSWQGHRGTSSAEAKRRYVLKVAEILPSFNEMASSANASAMPRPSREGEALRGASEQPAGRPALRATRSKRSTQTLSYAMIVLQLIGLTLGSAAAVWAVMNFVYPVAYWYAVERFGQEYCDSTMRSFAPLLWFSLGYLVVITLRSRIFSWRLLSGEFVWVSLRAPSAVCGRRMGCRRRRRRRRHEPVETDTERAIKKFNIALVTQPNSGGDSLMTPRLELALSEDANASVFGESTTVIPFTVEQSADMYYRKFKEPLPDPASRLLMAIVPMEEHVFDEHKAVFKRRLLRFRNDTPYLIKRFANAEFVEYVEDTLLDTLNRRFYVYVKNLSFQNLGVLEDYSVYKVETEKWTELHQYCRVHITSSSLSFFRSQIEAFISDFYGKNAPLARQYHVQRLTEEFGAPEGLPPVDV